MRTSVDMPQPRLHFVKIAHRGYYNQGDMWCSPFPHFESYFSKFDCTLHSMDGFHYQEIGRDDIVILGGGGILDFEPRFNDKICRLLDSCDTVILWGGGQNGLYDTSNGPIQIEPKIEYDRFTLSGIRDVGHPIIKYTPCPSSVMPKLKEITKIDPSFKFGAMFFKQDAVDKISKIYPNFSHYNNIGDVLNFISNFETIITESYHCALWSILSGRHVIMPSYVLEQTKFNNMRYNPLFFDMDDILCGADLGQLELISHPGAYDESRALVFEFFTNVKMIVEQKVRPSGFVSKFSTLHRIGELSQVCDSLLNENVQLKRTISDMASKMEHLVEKLEKIQPQEKASS